jgi:hypothetical protein
VGVAKIEAVKIDVRDAFLHFHQTGLDGFERWQSSVLTIIQMKGS